MVFELIPLSVTPAELLPSAFGIYAFDVSPNLIPIVVIEAGYHDVDDSVREFRKDNACRFQQLLLKGCSKIGSRLYSYNIHQILVSKEH